MAGGNFGGGTGAISNPYLVEDALDMDAMRGFRSSHFLQTKDIDLSSFPDWHPLFQNSDATNFQGSFDGGNHVIKGLRIDNGDSRHSFGLFDTITRSATLKNIILESPYISVGYNITSARQTGFLVGNISAGSANGGIASIHNVRVINGNMSGNVTAGGLIGYIGSTRYASTIDISNCSTTGSINSVSTRCGGLIGHVDSLPTGMSVRVFDCYSEINISGRSSVGGFIGSVGSPGLLVERCYSSGSVSAENTAGGFVGFVSEGSESSIKNCVSLCPRITKTTTDPDSVRFGDFCGDIRAGVQGWYALSSTSFAQSS